MPTFTPYSYNRIGQHMQLNLWKPWRARGQWGAKSVTLGYYATREEAEQAEREWREGAR